MEEFDFTEEEIGEQLEKLGYHNVPSERLQEFKRDLEQLVKNEKSRNSSWSTVAEGSSTESETSRSRIPLDENNYRLRANGHVYDHVLAGKENRGHPKDETSLKVTHVSSKGDHHIHDQRAYPNHPPHHIPRQVDYSLYSENENLPLQHQGAAPISNESKVSDMSLMDSSAMSDRRMIKRRVLRKRDGHKEVTDELTESEIGDTSSLEERLQTLHVGGDPRPSTAPPSHRDALTYHVRRPQSAASSSYQESYRLPEDYDGPTALIRPMTCNPHTRNIKKADPVSKYQRYRESWQQQRAPGEKKHNGLRWSVKEQMLYHDEVVTKKQHKVYVPNGYVIPSDKKRKNLRWQIRQDLAQGVKPPSMFD